MEKIPSAAEAHDVRWHMEVDFYKDKEKDF
jgi:hypothetical protein